MRKNVAKILVSCAVALSFALSGCGVGSLDSPTASNASKSTVFGVASLDTAATATVSVRDSSVPAQEKTAVSNNTGDYTVDVKGLTPPFILKAEGTGQTMYSISKSGGQATSRESTHRLASSAARPTASRLWTWRAR